MALVDEETTGELRFESMINPNGDDFTKNNPLPESMQSGDNRLCQGRRAVFRTRPKESRTWRAMSGKTKQRAGTARERTEFSCAN
jgi:hypothetical protein